MKRLDDEFLHSAADPEGTSHRQIVGILPSSATDRGVTEWSASRLPCYQRCQRAERIGGSRGAGGGTGVRQAQGRYARSACSNSFAAM